jgi:hypothetical protein
MRRPARREPEWWPRRGKPLAREGAAVSADEGNLAAVLVLFARWRRCCVCGSETLYVNEQARTDTDFECGLCQGIREDLAKKLRPPLPLRAALHLRALFTTANSNGTVRS